MVTTLRTGSRAGLLGIVSATVLVFLVGKLKTKIKMLVGAGLIFAIGMAFIPDSVLRRYGTVFNGTSYEADMSADERSAIESTRARKMLFEESVRVTLEHPFFGVGPGIFSAALAKEQEQRGELQTWHEAHNTFTQLGSEAGVPALIIYLVIVIYCLKRTVSVFRQTRRNPSQIAISRMAATLSMAMVIFIVCASFGTYSYTLQLPVLAGLVQAFDVCARRQLNKAPVIEAAAPPIQQPVAPVLKSRVPTYVRHRRLRDSRT
jgi:O-antigen ligase